MQPVIRIWWSRSGSEVGLPWYVQRGLAVERVKSVEIKGGHVWTEYLEGGHVELPEGPRAVICVKGTIKTT